MKALLIILFYAWLFCRIYRIVYIACYGQEEAEMPAEARAEAPAPAERTVPQMTERRSEPRRGLRSA